MLSIKVFFCCCFFSLIQLIYWSMPLFLWLYYLIEQNSVKWALFCCLFLSSVFKMFFVMSSRALSVFQHRCKAPAHIHRSRGRAVRLLRLAAWSRWREIVSLWGRQSNINCHNMYTKRAMDDILMMNELLRKGCWLVLPGTGRPTTGKEMCTNAAWDGRRTQAAIKWI